MTKLCSLEIPSNNKTIPVKTVGTIYLKSIVQRYGYLILNE